jgi:hypothetical protein
VAIASSARRQGPVILKPRMATLDKVSGQTVRNSGTYAESRASDFISPEVSGLTAFSNMSIHCNGTTIDNRNPKKALTINQFLSNHV